VRISFSDIDSVCDNEGYASEAKRIFKDMQGNGDLLLSFVVDSAIEIKKSTLGRYDHLIVVNPEWVTLFRDPSKLKPIEYEEIKSGMQGFLETQMPL
jgi:hypothetical protein